MITERQIRSVTLFFLFAYLDERAALRAAQSAIASLKVRLPAFATEDEIGARIAIIDTCASAFTRDKKHIRRGSSALTFESGWQLPAQTELAPWTRFHKDASDEELLAVLFSRVMGFSATEIANGLHISEGTARYRIGRGIHRLGSTSGLSL